MNIKEAKRQIKNSIEVYLSKDEFNSYLLPSRAQRPIIIMGAPGLGKTDIVFQISKEMGIGLVSYSMTHHTRQSVLGLPTIVEKEFGKMSEYTMSEIIAEVYETINRTGLKNGILFLDEINCVSETLVPMMLQFLQFKKIGQHELPTGWIIICAGNPTEFNKNARDFDIVTWDRIKRIDVEPDYPVWKDYMIQKAAHGAILSYLDIKKESFYHYEMTVDGNKFVTTRSWDDLSEIILAYEKKGIEIDLCLIQQYIQHHEIAEDFFNYYCLYKKYEADYEIDTILNGNYSKAILQRAINAPFDERYSLIGLMLNALTNRIKNINEDENFVQHLLYDLKEVKNGESINNLVNKENEKRERERRMGILTNNMNKEYEQVITFLITHLNESFDIIKKDYDMILVVLKDNIEETIKKINNIYSFIIEAYKEKEELTILTTELTVNYYSAHFIARHQVDKYNQYSQVLSLDQRNVELKNEVENIDTSF